MGKKVPLLRFESQSEKGEAKRQEAREQVQAQLSTFFKGSIPSEGCSLIKTAGQ